MENHTGQSDDFTKEDPPLKLIVDLCAQLADMGLEFQISLKIKDSPQFSLKSDNKASGQSAGGKRRRGASYRRRQMRRRAAYLEKKRASPEKGGEGVSGLIQDGSDQLGIGEHNISLDLDPTPIHWRGAPKGSVDEEPVSDHWHKSTEDEAAGMEADLEHDRADGEEWCEVGVTWGGIRREVKYRRVRGSNYCGHPVEVRAINDIYEFNEDGDNIIVFAPRGVQTTDISIRLSDASFVNGEIDFLRKIRENTYEYVG